jgi:7-cyano-7-deazaguanine synthase
MNLGTNKWTREADVVGLLFSGGLDSSILLRHMLDGGRRIRPLYIRSGLYWQAAEESALKRYLDTVGVRQLEPLTVLNLPLADLYGDHWSVSGRNPPSAGTADHAVFLPGRNMALTIKAALWCQMHGIKKLAMATLASNPFEDASASFFDKLEQAFNVMGPPIQFVRPFAELRKKQVMELGRNYPLGSTFSCIAPYDGEHCGRCNKCAERQEAFRLGGRRDPTYYAFAAAGERRGG